MSDALLALREYAKLAPWNIRDLAAISGGILDASGVTPINAAAQSHPSDRTIRFYVTRHLMSPPEGRGTAATYNYRHLLQLLSIKLRQMEGATLATITKDIADSPGDVLEKRVATALGTLPVPEEIAFAGAVAPRGRVARAVGRRPSNGTAPDGGEPAHAPVGAWYRIALDEQAEVSLRHDHPAARTAAQRQRVAERVARALRDTAADAGS
ncbi:MAG TPA: MerR family transcriptional regulator [Gemmatimonadales bacterium]|nr:MerR family transcriptional regulator [Gemmatimonadales bacterium]